MEYKIINKNNNKNRISRLNKELQTYKEYLQALTNQSHLLISRLQNKEKQKETLSKKG